VSERPAPYYLPLPFDATDPVACTAWLRQWSRPPSAPSPPWLTMWSSLLIAIDLRTSGGSGTVGRRQAWCEQAIKRAVTVGRRASERREPVQRAVRR
jgi:hypothetical protein